MVELDVLVRDKQVIKDQIGSTPDVLQALKRFSATVRPKRHSVKVNKAVVGHGSFILNSSQFGVLGTDELGRDGHTDSLYAVVPNAGHFYEYFLTDYYIDGSSTGTLNPVTLSYTLTTGQVLISKIVAKLRQPIVKATFAQNTSLVAAGAGTMTLPFTLGVDVFTGNSANIYLSNDNGTTWVQVYEGIETVFAASADTDELLYKVEAVSGLTLSDPIMIKVN